MSPVVRTLLIVLAIVVILPLWFWGVMSVFSGKRREDERSVLGGTLRSVRSGPLWSSRWEPNTGPAYLGTALLYLVGYIVAMFFGFNSAMVLVASLIAAGWYINQMRQTIGLGDAYAKAATAVFLATIGIAVLGLVLR